MSKGIEKPKKSPPLDNWEHYALWSNIQTILRDVPNHFKSTISVSGITVTEIYTFSDALSPTIEAELVRTLNDMRQEWDGEGRYPQYSFIRQPTAFPDVLLKDGEIIMGIELKSWYLLAKEGEPSFRFTTSAKACTEHDLIVIFPWVLSNVISGTPIIFTPYIELARYFAEYRNYWWQNVREAKGDTTIRSPKEAHPYPPSREEFSDEPYDDKGRNFGRIARIGIMDDYVHSFNDLTLLGIKVRYWRDFFKTGGEAFKDACERQLKLTNG